MTARALGTWVLLHQAMTPRGSGGVVELPRYNRFDQARAEVAEINKEEQVNINNIIRVTPFVGSSRRNTSSG
jgi:hypothetical protein